MEKSPSDHRYPLEIKHGELANPMEMEVSTARKITELNPQMVDFPAMLDDTRGYFPPIERVKQCCEASDLPRSVPL